MSKLFYDWDGLYGWDFNNSGNSNDDPFNEEWGIEDWPLMYYITMLGFANQIIAITDPGPIELYTMFDMVFSGQDAKFQRKESKTQMHILTMVYSDLVGAHGFHGAPF